MKNAESSKIVENIIGCKWSMAVLKGISSGKKRPGLLNRSISGLSRKVMNQRLLKLQRYGFIKRIPYPVIPPKVEYVLTERGKKFMKILKAIDNFSNSIS